MHAHLRLQGVKVVLTDGAAHPVDSNEMAFKLAAIQGFRQVRDILSFCALSFLSENVPLC